MTTPLRPAEMAALHAAAFADSRPWSEAEIADLLSQPTVQAASTPYGFALLQIIAPDAELLTIAVAPDHQGKGYGRTLLHQAMATARALAATSLFLEVDAENTRACALYAAAGFTRSGLRRGYYAHADGHRSDALMLRVALGPKPPA
ncbi:Ribosomal-protein-S18p-alanine acetyltransferase [Roseibacterium elongatum DSM 19469]|uniref:Ribosomal-protein-S18p-alanine acetyltransferase n=1 Tax=Roseicyclus elongatus DSM 19469 TaxID=1294273 RepID=W8RYE5_9RHOB|nr:GNAT family N-acetyltransferase [Roseibacterium elongatum]AHM02862.1 Ribosomal-protein-S18p-alanine acetyltransferase [Roseibacterium elongatum DSM 19469]